MPNFLFDVARELGIPSSFKNYDVEATSALKRKKTSYFARGTLALLALITCNAALAAGFDCKRATIDVEKLICSNEQLSALDESLNRQFREAVERADDRSSLVKDQKAWIQERNRCVDSKCLQMAYENRQASLKSSPPCPIQERDLLGHWIAKSEQDFEEMLFETRDNERLFLSWRHHRPEMPGIWTFQKCEIHIRHVDDPKLTFEYAVVKRSGRVLQLRELSTKETSSYMKAK